MEHISLTQYRIFFEVAKCQNITKASNILFISQPAISKALKVLEESLEVQLLIRNSRGVTLTDEGEILFSHLENAFSEISQAETQLNNINAVGLGTIRISASSTLSKYILVPYLKKFIRLNPHIKINLECRSTTYSLELLKNGKTDIGLIGRTDNQQNLDFHSVCNVNYVFVSTKSYLKNLNNRGFITTNEIFDNANIMLLDKDNVSRLHIDNYLSQNDIYPKNVMEVNNMDLLIDFAKIDMGIACVISDFIQNDIKEKRLIEIPLPASIPPREIGFAYNRNVISSVAMKKFVDFIETSLS